MEKVRISATIDDNVLKESKRLLEAANCKNISEYIRKAIETYNEYILDPDNEKWKPLAVKTLEKSIEKMKKRFARLMFKQEVEIEKCFLSPSRKNRQKKEAKNGMNRSIS